MNKPELDKKKILLIVLLSLFVLYSDFTFIIKSQIKNINELSRKISKLKTDLDTLTQDLKNMEVLKSKQAEVTQKTTAVAKKIIPEEQMSSLLQVISEIANKNYIKILQIKPSSQTQAKLEKAEKFSPLLITLDLSGDYHRFGHFINDLENTEDFIAVQELKINRQENNYLQQKINLVLKTYVKK